MEDGDICCGRLSRQSGAKARRPGGQEATAEVTTLGRGSAPGRLVVTNAAAEVLAKGKAEVLSRDRARMRRRRRFHPSSLHPSMLQPPHKRRTWHRRTPPRRRRKTVPRRSRRTGQQGPAGFSTRSEQRR